jgi:hypothetical protein
MICPTSVRIERTMRPKPERKFVIGDAIYDDAHRCSATMGIFEY